MARARAVPPRSRSNPMLYVMVVQALKQFLQLEQKPPVTVALILLNALAFFRPGELVALLPSTAAVCLNPHLVLKNWDVKRLLGSAFTHADETHLVYNMVSFLWKGVQLEGALGSVQFMKLVALLTLLSQGCTILVAKLMADQLGVKAPYYQQCAVGFSGVLFALKVVLNWQSPTFTSVSGFTLPTRYAAWAELLAIQYATPDASFVGHLGGIVAGLILVYIPRLLPRGLPFVVGIRELTPNTVASVETGRVETQRRTQWFSGRGTTGAQRKSGVEDLRRGRRSQGGLLSRGFRRWFGSADSRTGWACKACTYDNQRSSTRCEMCGYPRDQSGRSEQSTRRGQFDQFSQASTARR